ncbi:MAG: pyridoxal phosphate-dependent aminotransferase [Kiritimatiellae bacterium]|nr:pyridoxal phosphate-dependent aminotransferase [Kiritimatiellia bacterium]
MHRLSTIAQMAPSPIRRIYEKAVQMDDVVFFSLGEPDFDTPPQVVDAAVESLRRGETHYTPNAGIPPLREAIAENLRDYDHVAYDPATEIAVTSGGMEALVLALLALVEPGDEVILADPSYTNYRDQIAICKGVPVYVPVREENGFQFDPDDLRRAVTDKTRAIMVNTPANPTGAVASRENLEAVAALALEHGLYVIFDEVYKHLFYSDSPFFNIAALPGMRERTLVLDSCSKTYAMTGWRVGWIAGPAEVVGCIPKIQENLCSCVPAFVQRGAIRALRTGAEDVRRMNEAYRARRDVIVAGINAIPGLSARTPEGAFYLFVNVRGSGLTSERFAMRLLEEGRVALSPGSAFGPSGEGYARISYASSIDNLKKGLARIEGFMRRL